MPDIDVLASNVDQSRRVTIQVKAKYGGAAWQTTITRGRHRSPERENETVRFWILVDLRSEPPRYFVMPEWWIQNDIYTSHNAYLAAHGGVRPGNVESKHHAIKTVRVDQWLDRWDPLGIFDG
jgi:hypothetical protein